jgi:hypothetical protein
MWLGWMGKQCEASRSFTQPGGHEGYVEWGRLGPFVYLYWGNTFDQRQVVLVEADHAQLVRDYFEELVSTAARNAGGAS